jgi:hypothetical protein
LPLPNNPHSLLPPSSSCREYDSHRVGGPPTGPCTADGELKEKGEYVPLSGAGPRDGEGSRRRLGLWPGLPRWALEARPTPTVESTAMPPAYTSWGDATGLFCFGGTEARGRGQGRGKGRGGQEGGGSCSKGVEHGGEWVWGCGPVQVCVDGGAVCSRGVRVSAGASVSHG